MSETEAEKNEMLLKFVVEFDKRFQVMEEEIADLRGRLDEFSKGDNATNPEQWGKMQSNVKEMKDALARSNKTHAHLEKRVETVKNDSSSGLVISIVIFTILFIISLFIRS
uniref:Uncharacterized protein n=1 Tax=Magnetococcus massalia (strain MO-1) TaxID=451514 RepID=A0A1S7LGM4_MAGMO|nr:conserved protein of unknown function [Candidatus Magnetococcus massalia]